MDVRYKVRAWQDMKEGMNKLTKDTFVKLRQANSLVKDIQESIQDLDSDQSIYFHHKDQLETIGKLHDAYTDLDTYCDQAGQAVYEHIDKPFVETMDRFAQEMRDISIKNFETTNRIGSTTTTEVSGSRSYGGAPETITTTKPKITVDDIFRDSEAFNEVLRAEYEEWKRRDPNMKLDYEEYRRRVPSTRGFEYRSIEDEQKKLEAWRDFGLGSLTVGLTFICPLLGVAASLIFGRLQVKSASDGEDWETNRKLSEGERTERYVSGALEFITSGVGAVKGFKNIGSLGKSSEGALGFNPNEGKHVVQSLGDNNTLKNALNTVGNTPVVEKKSAEFFDGLNLKSGKNVPTEGESNPKSVKYYRVQSDGSDGSFKRLQISDDGKIQVLTKRSSLNLSAVTDEHAQYFLHDVRKGDGYILEFEVDDWFHEMVMENAIEQYGYRDSAFNQGFTAPKIVDPTKPRPNATSISLEFPPIWNDFFEEVAHNAKILK